MKRFALATLILSLLVGCERSDDPPAVTLSAESMATNNLINEEKPAVALNFTASAQLFYNQAVTALNHTQAECEKLFSAIDNFVAAPSGNSQLTAQAAYRPCLQSWRAAELYFQKPFSLTEADDFYRLVDLIDTRPFLPGYIDGIPEYPYSGLVHELDIPVTEDALRSQHRLMDEESASLGFPVIEFFLWRSELTDVWVTADPNKAINVTRRLDYLRVAGSVQKNLLQQALQRWNGSQFYALPERAQLNLVLQSGQRLVMVELLHSLFEESALSEPEWHHPAQISGQGRNHPLAMLKSLQALIGSPQQPTEFTRWLDANSEQPVTAEAMARSIAASIEAISQLPENYPAQSESSEHWQAARQALAEVTLHFSALMQHYNVPLMVE